MLSWPSCEELNPGKMIVLEMTRSMGEGDEIKGDSFKVDDMIRPVQASNCERLRLLDHIACRCVESGYSVVLVRLQGRRRVGQVYQGGENAIERECGGFGMGGLGGFPTSDFACVSVNEQ